MARDAPPRDSARQLLRHFLAALAYRFRKAVAGAPEGFGTFDAGHGVRPPRDLVHHMNGVLGYAREMLRGADEGVRYRHPQFDLAGEIEALHAMLAELDVLLRDPERGLDPERIERTLQGPLADAMTHVGQLALLRRVAGEPIPGENFYRADVRAGRVGAEQAPPVAPD